LPSLTPSSRFGGLGDAGNKAPGQMIGAAQLGLWSGSASGYPKNLQRSPYLYEAGTRSVLFRLTEPANFTSSESVRRSAWRRHWLPAYGRARKVS